MSQSPFKFLDSYTKEDKDIFFGRDSEIEELYTRIFHTKILLLYGASGTGKSSLINCGLANKFEDADWLPINIRRGSNILVSTRSGLEKEMITPMSSSTASLTKMLKSVYLDHFKPIYLIFDQFEELFIFGQKEEWEEFVGNVREILDTDIQVKIIFSIRGEYLEYLTEFERILPEIFDNRLRIERMTRSNAVQCITGPCQSAGIKVDEQFGESLLYKLSPNKTEIELTYLQVFLDRIYRKATESTQGESIYFSNSLIEDLGNIGDVLSRFLDEQIELIPDSEEALALLKAFVSTDATKKQLTLADAQRFVVTIGHDLNQEKVDRLIQELVNRRILKDKDESDRYELRHDSLAAKIFEKITNYERDLIEVNQFVSYAFGEHQKRAFLLNESDLAYIAPYESKLNLDPPVLEFIDKSRKVILRKKRSRKQFYIVLVVISVLLITSIFGFVNSQRQKKAADENALLAQQQSEEALRQKELAEQQRLLAQENEKRASEQATLANQQATIAEQEKQEADRQRRLANTLRSNAVERQMIAERQRLLADSAKEQAVLFSMRADSNAHLAALESERAFKLRMLTAAQALGVKATQLQDQDQKILIAQQAYKFNNDFGGYSYHHDIHKGLYEAYQSVHGQDFNSAQIHQKSAKGMISIGPGQYLTIGADGTIVKIERRGSEILSEVILSNEVPLESMAISLDKSKFAVGTVDGRVFMFQISNLKNPIAVKVHTSTIWAVEFDQNGNLYCSGENNGIHRLQNDTSTLIATESLVNTLSFDPGSNILVAGLNNGNVFLYDVQNDTSPNPDKLNSLIASHKKNNTAGTVPITKVKFSGAGDVLAIGQANGSILLVEADQMELLIALTGHRAMVSDLRFNEDGSFMVSASFDGGAMIWNMKDMSKQQIELESHEAWVLQALFDQQRKEVLTADAQGVFRYFSIDMSFYAANLCSSVSRNLTQQEWDNFVGVDIPYQETCPSSN